MVVTLKAFCQESGWPIKTIKRLANTGILPHWRQGRRYLFDKERTLQKLELLKIIKVSEPTPEHTQKAKKLPVTMAAGSRTKRLKALLKKNRQQGKC